MQMSWPGFALSPSDFKAKANPNGPYDPQVAEETFSRIADIAPTADELRFQDSGFEISNVYEALIFGAMPKTGPTDPATNPAFKLFLDAQFKFIQSAKGSIDDPDPASNYYACRATPIDWYSESNPNWQSFSLGAPQIKTATPNSPFVKFGGQRLVNQGVFRVTNPAVSSLQLRSQLQAAIEANIGSGLVMTKLANVTSAPVSGLGAAPVVTAQPTMLVLPVAPIRSQVLAKSGGTLDNAKLKAALVQLNAQSAFKKSARTTPAAAKLKVPAASFIDFQKLAVKPSLAVPMHQRLNLERLLVQQLPLTPIRSTTENWSLSFRYCMVSMNRNWLNTTLLSLPNWYFPGMPAGFFSSGVPGKNLPQFPMLPLAFLAIRDLRISASWSADDLSTLSRSASFGPFDIRSKVITQNELRSDGLQVIAWLCKTNPSLPPLSDSGG
jgi:hypothetical protein